MIDTCKKMLELRERAELNPIDFCTEFGLSLDSIEKWESGKSAPMCCVPFMVETLLNYKDRFGEVETGHVLGDSSDRLNELRGSTRLSQPNFSKKFMIKLLTYRNWERGINKPPFYIVPMIDKILRYEELFGVIIEDPEWAEEVKSKL